MKISHKKILIMGGATGIGLGLTEKLVEQNNTVIICGRRKDNLMKLKSQQDFHRRSYLYVTLQRKKKRESFTSGF